MSLQHSFFNNFRHLIAMCLIATVSIVDTLPAHASCDFWKKSKPEGQLKSFNHDLKSFEEAGLFFDKTRETLGATQNAFRRKVARAWLKIRRNRILKECLAGGVCDQHSLKIAILREFQKASITLGRASLWVVTAMSTLGTIVLFSAVLEGRGPIVEMTGSITLGIIIGAALTPVTFPIASAITQRLLQVEEGIRPLPSYIDLVAQWKRTTREYNPAEQTAAYRLSQYLITMQNTLLIVQSTLEKTGKTEDAIRIIAEQMYNIRTLLKDIIPSDVRLADHFEVGLQPYSVPANIRSLVMDQIRKIDPKFMSSPRNELFYLEHIENLFPNSR